MYIVHCTIYKPSLYTEMTHSILDNTHCTLGYSVYCTLYTIYCTLYTMYCTLYTMYCTLYIGVVHGCVVKLLRSSFSGQANIRDGHYVRLPANYLLLRNLATLFIDNKLGQCSVRRRSSSSSSKY